MAKRLESLVSRGAGGAGGAGRGGSLGRAEGAGRSNTWATCDRFPHPGQGALTHGDRRATESRDLSKYNFENKVPEGGWPRRGGSPGCQDPETWGAPASDAARGPHPSPQYGARALSCVLTTILSQTESKVPLPQGYPGGDAVFFRGELVDPPHTPQGDMGDEGEPLWGGAGRRARLSFPTDMKQGLLSVGIGGRESRSGCLDVEKGESHAPGPAPPGWADREEIGRAHV